MKLFRVCSATLLGYAGLFAVHAALAEEPKTAQEIIDFCSAKMAGVRTWSAKFTQTINVLGGRMIVDGQMTQKMPRQMRIESNLPMMGPDAKMLVVVGNDGVLWQDLKFDSQRQVMKMDIREATGNTTLEPGIGLTAVQAFDINREWQATKDQFDYTVKASVLLRGERMYVLESQLKPSAMSGPQRAAVSAAIGRTRLYIGQQDGFVHRMVQLDHTGTNTIMIVDFNNVKFNPVVPDEIFVYDPPPDVPVVDMTQLVGATPTAEPQPVSTPPAPPASE